MLLVSTNSKTSKSSEIFLRNSLEERGVKQETDSEAALQVTAKEESGRRTNLRSRKPSWIDERLG